MFSAQPGYAHLPTGSLEEDHPQVRREQDDDRQPGRLSRTSDAVSAVGLPAAAAAAAAAAAEAAAAAGPTVAWSRWHISGVGPKKTGPAATVPDRNLAVQEEVYIASIFIYYLFIYLLLSLYIALYIYTACI